MFEGIASHMTRRESPAALESTKENNLCVGRGTSKSQASKVSTVSSAQVVQELGLNPPLTVDCTSDDGFFEENMYLSRSETTLDGGSSADSSSGGPSNESATTFATSALSRSLKDAMVIDFGVMTFMCFAGSPLKREEVFEPSVISRHEDSSLMRIKNIYVKSPQASPQVSFTDHHEPDRIPIMIQDPQDAAVARVSVVHIPLTSRCSQRESLAVASDEGVDDEDVELNCNNEHSTRVHSSISQNGRGNTAPKYFSSDSKSPSIASSLTSGSTITLEGRTSIKEDERSETNMGQIILQKKSSTSYGHGCYPVPKDTKVVTSSHGSSGEELSTASSGASDMGGPQIPNPVVKPSSWNDLFCNINVGIFDLDDPESPLGLGCRSPTADAASRKGFDSTDTKDVDMQSIISIMYRSPEHTGDRSTSSSADNKKTLITEGTIDTSNKSSDPLTISASVPHTDGTGLLVIPTHDSNEKEKSTTSKSKIENMHLLEMAEDILHHDNHFAEHGDENSASEKDLHAYISLQSAEDYFVGSSVQYYQNDETAGATSISTESSQTASRKDAECPLKEIDFGVTTDIKSSESQTLISTSEDDQRRTQQEKDEEEACRKAYYRHRRQLYLESHLKMKLSSDARSAADDESEERPFDCGNNANRSSPKSFGRHDDTSMTNSVAFHASSLHATYLRRKQATNIHAPFHPSFVHQEVDDPSVALSNNSNDMTAPTSHKAKPLVQGRQATEADILYHSSRSDESLAIDSGARIAFDTGHEDKNVVTRVNWTVDVGHSTNKRATLASLTNDPGYSVHRTTNARLMADSGSSYHRRTIGEQLTTDSTRCHQNGSGVSLVSDAGNRHNRTTDEGLATDYENSHHNHKRVTTGLAPGGVNILQERTTFAGSMINPGFTSHTKTGEKLKLDVTNSHHKRTTIMSLAADSGISNRIIKGEDSSADLGARNGVATEIGTCRNGVAVDSESSSHSRTFPCESNSSHHRRVDRLNYLKKVRCVKATTNALAVRTPQPKVVQ